VATYTLNKKEFGIPRIVSRIPGAGFLRNSKLENVVNVRASYGAETEAWVRHLTEDLGHPVPGRRVRPLRPGRHQGRAKKRNMELAAEGTFERNTIAVKSALLTLKRAEPEAVVMVMVMVGPYKP
jgi:branched-chain amino acid transport system substrate-binding protein